MFTGRKKTTTKTWEFLLELDDNLGCNGRKLKKTFDVVNVPSSLDTSIALPKLYD